MRIARALAVVASVTALATATSFTPASAIVNGSAAPEGAYPFMAAIVDSTDFQFCGGSVISSSYVLTAAHCVLDIDPSKEATYVITGRTNLSNTSQGQRIRVSAISVHPKYDGNAYDAAVLRLASPTTSPAITLASAANDNLETPGTVVRVTGWGDQTPTLGLNSTNSLRYVDLKVVSDSECGVANLGFDAPTGVCAEELLKDSCNGDSGGPLFYNGTTRIQIGIVSYGNSCAVPKSPGVYSEVNNTEIRSFIKNVSGV
ncbi:MAG TPA: serine protease [Frankiaceae bacterium]|jgi:trypsin|nr:serine protease [Frankiaceae bacterium]